MHGVAATAAASILWRNARAMPRCSRLTNPPTTDPSPPTQAMPGTVRDRDLLRHPNQSQAGGRIRPQHPTPRPPVLPPAARERENRTQPTISHTANIGDQMRFNPRPSYGATAQQRNENGGPARRSVAATRPLRRSRRTPPHADTALTLIQPPGFRYAALTVGNQAADNNEAASHRRVNISARRDKAGSVWQPPGPPSISS
jgi:hypothetical protein